MERKQKTDSKSVKSLNAKIDRLIKENVKDLEEMAERGKDLVQLANAIRGFSDLIEKHVYDHLMIVVIRFERRCELAQRRREKKC